MKNILSTMACGWVLVLSACGAQPPAPTYSDVLYGPYDRNQMDFYAAPGDGPHPALLVLHPGGFTGGSKEMMRDNPFLWKAYSAGFSLAMIDYRFITGNSFSAPFMDGARAVQFLRYKAKEWDVDLDRIGAFGGSAGANIAVWLAVQDDLANPESSDPVERESTRLRCVVGNAAQTFNDPLLILQKIGGNPMIKPDMMKALGADTPEQLRTLESQAMAFRYSAINYVSSDDPPLYLVYDQPMGTLPLPLDTPIQRSVHHPMFGILMQEKYRGKGLECIVVTPENKGPDLLSWIKKNTMKHEQMVVQKGVPHE